MASGGDLSLTILGFLHERPMHGYELKSRLTALTGHLRPVSDGALYPAISRLEGRGLVERHEEAGAAAQTYRAVRSMNGDRVADGHAEQPEGVR
ncbi:PadR family transcriptional regulator, partial [Nonomuraea fuscirosea]